MPKKKNNVQSSDASPGDAPAPAPAFSPSAPSVKAAATQGQSTKSSGSPVDATPSLIICRNKHWRYISSFHGPWLQMPIEILETIANINFNAPRPRPIDPAVLFDLVKIRRLVDEATNLAVRAASDVASPAMGNMYGGMNGHGSSALGFGGGHGTKLSRERKFRMREQAAQKLARAYRFDEIACSVATMQGASTLEEIGALVLQRNANDPDAKYVHFFHEKIPSRQLAASTSLVPLRDIIDARPTEAETWRTSATVRIFKEDYEEAAMDLTQSLQIHRFHRPHLVASPLDAVVLGGARRPPDVVLSEEQHPSSLETQLLFQRANVYLTLACQHVATGLPDLGASSKAPKENGEASSPSDEAPREPPAQDKETTRRQLENRKIVKTYAKRALRDYMAYLSQLDYTPDLPIKVTRDFTDKVNMSAQGNRHPRLPDSGGTPTYKVYPLTHLFNAVAPSDIPPYPPQDLVLRNGPAPELKSAVNEAVTYHPLLTDALHSLLLCHCLVQTSAKELLRHAYMVARLARLADGYPVFQASRSPARADWLEVLRRAENWINLTPTWEELCAPAPLPSIEGRIDSSASRLRRHHPAPDLAAAAAAAVAAAAVTRTDVADSIVSETDEQIRRERIRQRAIMESLEDDRVVDEMTFRAAVLARQQRAEEDHEREQQLRLKNGSGTGSGSGSDGALVKSPSGLLADVAADGQPASPVPGSVGPGTSLPALRRWSVDDGREYPILTERAAAVARWVLEAPAGAGVTRRKKKGAAAKKGAKSTPDAGTALPADGGPATGAETGGAQEGGTNLALGDAD